MNSFILKWATHLKVYNPTMCIALHSLSVGKNFDAIFVRFWSMFCVCECCSLICCVCLCVFLRCLHPIRLICCKASLSCLQFGFCIDRNWCMSYFCVYCKRKHCTQKHTRIEWKQKIHKKRLRMVKWFISTRLQHAGFVIDLLFLLSYFIVYRATNE